MTISPLALAAKKVIDAAWLHGDAYDLSSQAAFALESAQLLQSPETAVEATELRRQLESARALGQRLIRSEQRTAELEAVLGTHRKDDQAEIERLRARLAIAEGLLAERDRPVDEAPIAYALTDKADPLCPVCTGRACCCTCFGKTPRKDCTHQPSGDDVRPQVQKLRSLLAGQRAEPGERR